MLMWSSMTLISPIDVKLEESYIYIHEIKKIIRFLPWLLYADLFGISNSEICNYSDVLMKKSLGITTLSQLSISINVKRRIRLSHIFKKKIINWKNMYMTKLISKFDNQVIHQSSVTNDHYVHYLAVIGLQKIFARRTATSRFEFVVIRENNQWRRQRQHNIKYKKKIKNVHFFLGKKNSITAQKKVIILLSRHKLEKEHSEKTH